MYKGKVKIVIGSGAAFIQSDDVTDDIYCNKRFVERYNLKAGDYIEFDCRKGFKNLEITAIDKVATPPNPLFDKALRIQELSPEEYDKFCDLTKQYVNKKDFKDNITTSKIRNIFSAVLKAKDVKEAKMLRPKIAYQAGRDSKTKFFMNELDKLLKQIETTDQLKSFKEFFEAIVCYKREIEK